MDRGAWRATVRGVAELDTIKPLTEVPVRLWDNRRNPQKVNFPKSFILTRGRSLLFQQIPGRGGTKPGES